jgi:hypothetical protein
MTQVRGTDQLKGKLPRWLIGIACIVSLTNLMLFATLSGGQRVEEKAASCRTTSCFIMPSHFHVLGFDVPWGTYQLLLSLLSVFTVLGLPLIVAGLLTPRPMRSRATRTA